MTYSAETEALMERLKKEGLNLWPMLAIFKRRSKLSYPIPDPVIQAVCYEFFKRKGTIRQDFPYFLMVLKRKSEEYFAQQNIAEGDRIKKEPLALKDIFRILSEQK